MMLCIALLPVSLIVQFLWTCCLSYHGQWLLGAVQPLFDMFVEAADFWIYSPRTDLKLCSPHTHFFPAGSRSSVSNRGAIHM